jgi:hypothetical protein
VNVTEPFYTRPTALCDTDYPIIFGHQDVSAVPGKAIQDSDQQQAWYHASTIQGVLEGPRRDRPEGSFTPPLMTQHSSPASGGHHLSKHFGLGWHVLFGSYLQSHNIPAVLFGSEVQLWKRFEAPSCLYCRAMQLGLLAFHAI